MENKTPMEFYEEEAERLQRGKERKGNKFDSVTLVLVPGTIALFVPLVFDMVKGGFINCLWLMSTSLFFLIMSVVLIVLNYFIVDFDFNIRFNKLGQFKQQISKNISSLRYDPENICRKMVFPINLITFISWLVGVIFMLVFFYYNINLINDMSKNQQEEKFSKSYANTANSYSTSTDNSTSTSTPSERPKQEESKETKK